MVHDLQEPPVRGRKAVVNSHYKVVPVNTLKLEKEFLRLPEKLYRNDLNWIPAVREDVAAIFDHSKNPYFKHGNAARWVLFDREGEAVGRIAAFVNFDKMYDEGKRVGGIGFFECIHNEEAAFMLFDTAIRWLTDTYHVELVDGPINFGENDKFWGLLIRGFTPPSYGMNYNPPYYQHLFESNGFRILYRQFTNSVDLANPLPERFCRIAQRVTANPRYSFRPFRYKNKEQFASDFVQVYNRAWAGFKNYHPMDEAIVRNTMEEMKPVMVEDFVWFAYADGKPVGLLVALPDINQVIRYSGARFNWWGKLKFLYYKYARGFSCVRVVVMGIAPEVQRHGLESAMIYHAFNEGRKRPRYKNVQLAWVGDFNDKMIAIHRAMGAVEDKQHATWRKVL